MDHPITPPLGWVLDLLNEARKRAKSSGWFGEVDYVYMVNKSAQMGWDQRGEANEAELQQRADQELEECLEHLSRRGFSDADICGLRAARRPTPKPPSEADQALADLDALVADLSNHGMGFKTTNLRRALERLKELEASND